MIVTVCGCTPLSVPAGRKILQSFVYEERMGLARWRKNRGCLAVFNSVVAPQTSVALVSQPDSPGVPAVNQARVVERLSQACDDGLSGPNDDGVVPSFYQIVTADGTTPPTDIVFAILDPPSSVVVRDGHIEPDLDGDGAKESFRICNSTETVHFMVWTGSPAQGRPRWHGTYYVGYDMVPSCTDQDVAGMVALEKQGTPAR